MKPNLAADCPLTSWFPARLSRWWKQSLAIIALATTIPGHADPVLIADARADYRGAADSQTTATATADPAGLLDTAGAGHWNYYVISNGTPTLMTWPSGYWSSAYGGGGNGWGTVTDQGIWDGVTPAAGELAWHPGEGTPTLVRWTAGASQAGTIQITGTVDLGAVSFAIKVDGTQVFTSSADGAFDLSDLTVSAGSNVDFIVTGGAGGASKISAQIYQLTTGTFPPPRPLDLTARGVNQQVNLSWSASPAATGYNVKRSLTSGGSYTTIAPNYQGTTYHDTDVSNGTSYYYVVSAINDNGESSYSSEASAMPAPVIADIRADYQRATAGQTTASFGGGLGIPDSVGEGHWNYLRADGVFYQWGQSEGTSLGYGDTSGSHWGTVTDQTIWGVTPASNELAWHPDDAGSTVIRWTAGSAEAGTVRIQGTLVPGAVTFTIHRDGELLFSSAASGNSFNLADVTINTGSTVDFTLNGGGGGSSRISAEISQMTTGSFPPVAPTGLVITGINQQANLSWNAVPGVTGYQVKRSLTGAAGSYTTVGSNILTTTYSDKGLTNGTTYYYVVSAVNEAGEGPDSSPVGVTPAMLLADIRGDYQAATAPQTTAAFDEGLGLPAAASGHWNYYWQNMDDNSLTLLPYGGNSGNPYAYGGLGHRADGGWSNVSNQPLWGATPASNQLAWHPGGDGSYNNDPGHEGPTVIRWTAAEDGTLHITGAVTLGSATFKIKVDDQEVFSSTSSGAFDLTDQPIAAGGTVDFVLYGGPGGASLISAKIFGATVAPPADPYADWVLTIPGFTTDTDPALDPDRDGLTNQQEFAFGLDPTKGSSANPIRDTSTLQSAGQFSYTRLGTSGLEYTIWTSPDLSTWTHDATAGQVVTSTLDGIETVTVTLSTPPTGTKLFVRVAAGAPTAAP